MTENNNGNGHRNGFLRDFLDAILWLGGVLWVRRNEEDSEQDEFFTSEELGTNLTDEKAENDDNRN